MTNPTEAAKAIRKDLKAKYPTYKFSVTTEKYSGGNCVTVYCPKEVEQSEVSEMVNKYRDGKFDGMIDSYEYNQNSESNPTAQYILTQAI